MKFLSQDTALETAILSSTFATEGLFTFSTALNLRNKHKYGPLHTLVVSATLAGGEIVDSLKLQARWLPPFYSYTLGAGDYSSMTGTVTAAAGCALSSSTVTCSDYDLTQTITPVIGSPHNIDTTSQIYYYVYTSNYERASLLPCTLGECLDDNQCDVAKMACSTTAGTTSCTIAAWPQTRHNCTQYAWPDGSTLIRCNIGEKCYWQEASTGAEDCTFPENCVTRCAVETCPSTGAYAFALKAPAVTAATNAYKAGGFRYWWDETDHKNMMASIIWNKGAKTTQVGVLVHVYARDTSDSRWKHIVSQSAYELTGTDSTSIPNDARYVFLRAPPTFNIANGYRAIIQKQSIEYGTDPTIAIVDGAASSLGSEVLIDSSAVTAILKLNNNQVDTTTGSFLAALTGCDNVVIIPYDFYHMSWSDLFPRVYELEMPDQTACASSVGAGYTNLVSLVRPTWLQDVNAIYSPQVGKLVVNPVELAKYFQPGTLYSDIYIYHQYSTTATSYNLGTVGRQFQLQIPGYDLMAGHTNPFEVYIQTTAEETELGFCGATPWDYSMHETGFQVYQTGWSTTQTSLEADLDLIPAMVKAGGFGGSAQSDWDINLIVFDADTYAGVESTRIRMNKVRTSYTHGSGNVSPVGFEIKASCKTPFSYYTGFDFWVEFLDRPLNQFSSVYDHFTYTTTMNAATIQQSRVNPSFWRVFGSYVFDQAENMILTLTNAAAGTYIMNQPINLRTPASMLTSPSSATAISFTPNTGSGNYWVQDMTLLCGKRQSEMTQNIICEGVCILASGAQYIFFQTTKSKITTTIPGDCNSRKLRYCIQAGFCVEETLTISGITLSAPTYNTAALATFLTKKEQFTLFACSYTALVAGISTEAELLPFAVSYFQNMQYSLAVPMYYNNTNGERIRYINPIAIRHLINTLKGSYDNLQSTYANLAKTTSLWVNLFYEFGLLLEYSSNAVDYFELPQALFAEYKDTIYAIVLDCWVLKNDLATKDKLLNTNLVGFVTRFVEKFKNGAQIDVFGISAASLNGIFGEYRSFIFNSQSPGKLTVALTKCSFEISEAVVGTMMSGANQGDNIYTIIERRVTSSQSSQTLAANGNITPLTTLGVEIYFRNRYGVDIPIPAGETIKLTLTTDTDGTVGRFDESKLFWFDNHVQSEVALSATTKTFYVTSDGFYAILAAGTVFKRPPSDISANNYKDALDNFKTDSTQDTENEKATKLYNIATTLEAQELAGKTEAVAHGTSILNRISDGEGLNTLSGNLKTMSQIIRNGEVTASQSETGQTITKMVTDLLPRVSDSVLSPATTVSQDQLKTSIQDGLETMLALKQSSTVTDAQKTTIDGYLGNIRSAILANVPSGSAEFTYENGKSKRTMIKANSLENAAGVTMQNSNAASAPKVTIPPGEFPQDFLFDINSYSPSSDISTEEFKVVGDSVIEVVKYDTSGVEVKPSSLQGDNRYTFEFSVFGISCSETQAVYLATENGSEKLKSDGITFESEKTDSTTGGRICEFKSEHLTAFTIATGETISFKEEVVNGIFIASAGFALLLGLVMDTQSPPRNLQNRVMIDKLDRKLEMKGTCSKLFYAFYYMNSVVSVFTAKDRFIWGTTRVFTLVTRLAFIFFLTGYLFSKRVTDTFGLDKGIGKSVSVRAPLIAMAVAIIVWLLRMFGVFAINFCIRRTNFNKNDVDSIRGEISIDLDMSRQELAGYRSDMGESRTSNFSDYSVSSPIRSRASRKPTAAAAPPARKPFTRASAGLRNDKKGPEIIQELPKKATRGDSKTSVTGLGDETLDLGERGSTAGGSKYNNIANLGAYQLVILIVEIVLVGAAILLSVLFLDDAFSSSQVFWTWLMTSLGIFAAGAFIIEPIFFAVAVQNDAFDEELRPSKHKCCAMISFGFKNTWLLRERKLLGGTRQVPGNPIRPIPAPYHAHPVNEEDGESED